MKRLLVALDGSQRAPTVLAAAARMAELASGTLIETFRRPAPSSSAGPP